jgi:hypothetical protein
MTLTSNEGNEGKKINNNNSIGIPCLNSFSPVFSLWPLSSSSASLCQAQAQAQAQAQSQSHGPFPFSPSTQQNQMSDTKSPAAPAQSHTPHSPHTRQTQGFQLGGFTHSSSSSSFLSISNPNASVFNPRNILHSDVMSTLLNGIQVQTLESENDKLLLAAINSTIELGLHSDGINKM